MKKIQIMKTMKFYAMMFIVAAMSFGLAACGDDDKTNGGGNGGGGTSYDYVGDWIIFDHQDGFGYVELTVNTWKNVEYHVRDNVVTKNIHSGDLTVEGNRIHIGGSAPFSNASYAISGNTMRISYSVDGEGQSMQLKRVSSTDDAAKIAAWEAMYQASKRQ